LSEILHVRTNAVINIALL